MKRLPLVLLVGFLIACGDSSSPVAPPPPPTGFTVSGTVTDSASMQPLAGAKVEWQDAMADAPDWHGVQTDSTGAYRLTVSKIPAIEFHVSMSGYVDQDLITNVREDMTKNFALTPGITPSMQPIK